jgi:hypothetical protein
MGSNLNDPIRPISIIRERAFARAVRDVPGVKLDRELAALRRNLARVKPRSLRAS